MDLLQSVAATGALGLALIGVWALGTGRVRVGTLVDSDKVDEDERFTKLERERDDWKALAQSTTPELKRLNDLLDTAVKLLLDPARRPPAT
jgi:hypothetical protein